MKYFQQLAAGINVTPLMNALQRQPELWDRFPIRTQHPGTAHAEVSDILVFFNSLDQVMEGVVDDKETIPFPAWAALPQLRTIIFDLMRTVEGVQLGRVIITRLPPGKTITPHVDQGAPATWFNRYQIALQSLPGALFHIGDETVNFRSGDVWMIDNQTEHSVVNNSTDDRIVCIVDIRCA
ncbi:aspartyl/asparaginyl beta-hydroxylase domain-containing protein [Rhizobium puerariae]|uniref:Aspartyl/asparaginyl beta-hydroxylase domain-containing protein n=1 Tax=Rhizobium puerariae TaxID=1585791 RepID=A0ABV6ARV2_9HYPH